MLMKKWICLLSLLAMSAPYSWGQTELTAAGNDLYDTGWSSAGAFQSNSNLEDGHYILESITPDAIPPTVTLPGPTYGVTNAEVTAASWTQANSATGSINGSGQTVGANWISFSASTNIQANVENVFDYRLSLTNIPVGAIVTITGNFGGDDSVSVFADGSSTALFTNPNWGTSATGTFTFTADGADYLDFDVTNDNNSGGYTGLYVDDLTGSYTAVPEPREWSALVLLGLAAVVVVRKLRGISLRSA